MLKNLQIFFLIIFILSCNDPISPTLTQADKNANNFLKILEETVEEHNVPGAILLAKFEDGSIFKDAYGLANVDDNSIEKMTTDKNFRIGSVTKTFIGTAILILVKDGVLNLSDTVETLMPGLIKHGRELTIEMLLNQTSALPSYTWVESFMDIYVSNPIYNWNSEEIYSLFVDEELLSTTHDSSFYSNSNYYLLGSIIEKYSNKTLNQFLYDEIFEPLGMISTYFPTTDELKGNFAHGYFDVNQDGVFTVEEDYTVQNPKAIWAAGGIVSTVDDLLIWMNELLMGNLLNQSLQTKRMVIETQIAGAPTGVNYGLGIASIFGAVGHTGAVSGYSTILFKYNGTIFIAFGNGYETANNSPLIADVIFEKIKDVIK